MIRFSFEVFPPKTLVGIDNLATAIERLRAANPPFVSVTYGAGGSDQDRSFAAIETVRATAPDVDVAAHLTCVGQSVTEIDAVLDRFSVLGVRRVVALRGDPAGGLDAPYVAPCDGYQRTDELVAAIAARNEFAITVSAYPEVHPQSPSPHHDIEVLGAKVAAGADSAMTQMFFDNELFYAYRDRVRAAGLEIALIPGIFPIHDIDAVTRFATSCKATMPTWISQRFADLGTSSDPMAARAELAVEIASAQIDDLAAHGVEQVHLYTLNKPGLALDVYQRVQAHQPTPAR